MVFPKETWREIPTERKFSENVCDMSYVPFLSGYFGVFTFSSNGVINTAPSLSVRFALYVRCT
jgi:hypothetical protein